MATAFHLIEIESNIQKVMECFLSAEGIKGWWTEDASINSENPKIYELKFGPKYQNKMEVVNETENSVKWLCKDGADEWVGTTLNFDVEPVTENKCILRFKHDQWKESSDFFASCNTIWGYYMESIKGYCEKGKGTPALK